MNWEHIEAQWKDVRGKVRETWGKLTDDDVEWMAGKKDRLLGKLQERYGDKKDSYEGEIDRFIASLNKPQKS